MASTTYIRKLVRYADDPLGYGARLEFTKAEADALPIRKDGSRRYLCYVEDLGPWHVAMMHDGLGDFFLIVNKVRAKKLTDLGYELNKLRVKLTADTSKYGMAMPAELDALLQQDALLDTYFQLLTPGKQRALLHIIGKPKGEATRLRKAVEIGEYLVAVQGKLDFAELGSWIKEMRGR